MFGMGEMPIATALAAIEKYASERDGLGMRLLREVIPSTMGEPLLYSHFKELLDGCSSIGVPLNLTTNGTFPGMWGRETGMEMLLRACRDIKLSYLASECFDGWKSNVEKLLRLRNRMRALNEGGAALNCAHGSDNEDCAFESREYASVSTVSLQVTLHKKNLHDVPAIVSWASEVGIDRIKWNKVVLLKGAPLELRREYVLVGALDDVRGDILALTESFGNKVKNGGALFMDCAHGRFSLAAGTCPFVDEVWVLPDGSEDHCPSPERRYGDAHAECCFIEM